MIHHYIGGQNVQNTLPVLMGTVTILGVAIDNTTVFFITMVLVSITCIVTMIGIILRCRERMKRMELIQHRRGGTRASTNCG